jgi:hypothetical protein
MDTSATNEVECVVENLESKFSAGLMKSRNLVKLFMKRLKKPLTRRIMLFFTLREILPAVCIVSHDTQQNISCSW